MRTYFPSLMNILIYQSQNLIKNISYNLTFAKLKEMKDKGAATFVQNEESSVVFGMPGEAVKLDAATYILSPEEIADRLYALVKKAKERFL